MHRHWRLTTTLLIGLLVAITYFGATLVSSNHDRSLANTGARIVRESCEQTNRVSLVTQAALMQQKRLSQQKFVRGETTRVEWAGQRAALNLAIRGLAPRDCEAAARELRESV